MLGIMIRLIIMAQASRKRRSHAMLYSRFLHGSFFQFNAARDGLSRIL
jgi:hypothetical protein